MPKTTAKKTKDTSRNINTSINGDVKDSVVISGDGNQTTFQKIINIFRGESESIDQRNRRVMLNHVENFWVKGVLEKSLHGVALLELGIKEDSNAVNYPWGIKKAATNETVSAGKSMHEIFKEIGLGRSLLILGAPGSGKTTMLLELTRQLIDLARNDETEPIPVVFNLASWTEKQSLTEWLAQQLNIFYYVPKKTAQKFVTDNKMFLLLDGLDEVKEDLREKCVNAINEFKNEHGLTSLAICSRIEEYQAIQTKFALAGAITLQPLTLEQVDEYFNKFGKSLSSLRQILKKDRTLHELTETPLMLSIMVLAYKDVNIKEIPELKNSKEQRKHLFDTYVNRMFERPTRSEKKDFSKEETLHYLSWLTRKMIKEDMITYHIEAMQFNWLENKTLVNRYKIFIFLFIGLGGKIEIEIVDKVTWSLEKYRSEFSGISIFMIIISVVIGLVSGLILEWVGGMDGGLMLGLIGGLILGLAGERTFGLLGGLKGEQIEQTTQPSQRLKQTGINILIIVISTQLIFAMIFVIVSGLGFATLIFGVINGLIFGLIIGLIYGGGSALIKHYILRLLLIRYKLLPWRLISFLQYCVDLIFLRRVGGGYIFVHRLLMEHFAEMYTEKENK